MPPASFVATLSTIQKSSIIFNSSVPFFLLSVKLFVVLGCFKFFCFVTKWHGVARYGTKMGGKIGHVGGDAELE